MLGISANDFYRGLDCFGTVENLGVHNGDV